MIGTFAIVVTAYIAYGVGHIKGYEACEKIEKESKQLWKGVVKNGR